MKNTGTFRSVAATASLSLALLLTGCDGLPGVQTTSVPDAKAAHAASLSPKVDASALVEAGYLTVGLRTSSSTAPFCVTSDGSQVQGLDVELAYALGDELGLRVKFVDVSDAGSSLGQSCDVVMGMKGSDTNAAVLAGSYAESAAALFRRGSTGVAKIEDLSSKKLGLQAGSVSEKTLGNTGLVVERASYSNLNEAFADLEAGKVDYVLCDAYSGAYLAKAYDDIRRARRCRRRRRAHELRALLGREVCPGGHPVQRHHGPRAHPLGGVSGVPGCRSPGQKHSRGNHIRRLGDGVVRGGGD